MENASKALIIAGAILISILLISVGIIIMNAINDPVQQGANAADSQAIEIFNAKFTSYAGKQKGTTVRQLITTVMSSNGTNTDHQVKINGQNTATLSSYETNKEYTVDMTFDTNGYVDNITIQ